MAETGENKAAPGRWGVWRRLPWLCVLLAIAGGVALNWLAAEADHAIVNVLTFLLSVAGWLFLVLALMLSRLPRLWWLTALFGPILAMVVLFSLYRIERLDGELNPQFRSRWQTAQPLPKAKSTATAIPAERWESRPTDFPQFLGKNRDGMLAGPEIEDDWQANPPEIAWKVPVGDGWSSFAVQGDVAITMEQRGEQEWVTAYDLQSGQLWWKYAIDALHTNPMGGTGPRSTPTIAGSQVFACSAVSRLVCLDLATGEEQWSQDLLALTGTTQAQFELAVAWGRAASPLVSNGLVIIPLGGAPGKAVNTLIAFDVLTGEERWRAGDDQISYASPVVFNLLGAEQLLIVAEKKMLALDPVNGRSLWSVDWPGSSAGGANISQPVQVNDRQILMSKGYGGGCQVIEVAQDGDQWSVETKWTNPTALKTKFTSAVVHDGYAYALSDGILECIALSDGSRQWKRGRYKQGQVLLVGHRLLITAENGSLVLVDATPERFTELATLPVIGDVTWNTPALAGKRLLMRNSDEAACVLLPVRSDVPLAGRAESAELENGSE